ncbi:MAG TPA: 2'-5' RNA ligase family protein [Bryobacteraceae bacterium]|nr:2'-5' RNA ligase family protein [Bryobacteraceae bacterium]
MSGSDVGEVKINSFAVVSYFTGPLAEYLTRLRRELVADCEARAHLTVLPPRPMEGSVEDATRGLFHGVQDFQPILVELGGVELFPESRVIYVSVKTGQAELERMHDALNTGGMAFEEPFPYHPHITLAQDLPPESIAAVLDRARSHWNNWPHPRSFVVEKLTLVQNSLGNRWFDLEDVNLVSRVAS